MKYSKPKSKSILSLDIGTKRIGLAYCDSLFITVNILPALRREKNKNEFKTIKSHIKKLNLTGFIVGLPLDDKGRMTSQAFDCKTYGEYLFNELKLPFSFVNEHSSTWESENRFGVKKDKSGLIDSLSAKVILEQWIQEGPELKELMGNKQI
ncbi:Predicted endonuclease involved in recombination [Prochlorococcus marinus str. MIT 9515]|uniref:Putative pre-16S rRNA nuclease n=1 Tax=Prochlorococcus marinus (strain MIT 9515) TaxID=167542 RepID=YQGF_PROM5|nr:Holliday junction resolvase RuvX [Prochlorococcus marinus]A2BW38.1 RecName: Full=Putative pre-16S rRNA nuclease [Prochlorococcus marinus str. MIT 9515]ABM71999.1 Predicted endonuclease involved in recombination [Prochlorococcus marinus str. MIT 9515]